MKIHYKKTLLRNSLIIALMVSCYTHSYCQNIKKGTLSITITGIKNTSGNIQAILFDNPEGFPSKPEKGIKNATKKANKNTITIDFQNISFGYYALSILHDTNNNQKMDFNLIGIPKEGYGISNNAKGIFGPPSFEKAKFHFKKHNQKVSIKLVNE